MRYRGPTLVVMCSVAIAGAVVGLATPAAGREASHLINGSSIHKHTIAGNRLKNNTVTGKQIKESTLGTVPNASQLGGLPPTSYAPASMWAYVGSDGTIGQQSGGISLAYHNAGYPGLYYLTFPTSLVGHPIIVTPHYDQAVTGTGQASAGMCGDSSGTDTQANGEIECTVGGNTNQQAFILLTDSGGTSTAEGFYILVP
jgi:hypothetical protein